MRRRLILGVLAVPLLIFLYRVLAIYTVRSGDCRPRPDAPEALDFPPNAQPLVVMTWNIAGHDELVDGDHVRQVAEAIRRIHPDVVALQEVHRGTWQSRFRDQLAELESLTGLHGAFAPSYVQWGGGYGNAILTRGRVVDAEVHPLPCLGEPRSLLEATIHIDGATISFYSTHLTSWGRLNAKSRAEQLRCLAQKIRTSPHPYILAGDFNTGPQSEEMEAFRRENAVQLASQAVGPTFPGWNAQIDHIFADPAWQVRAARTWPIEASDHLPVTAELMRGRVAARPRHSEAAAAATFLPSSSTAGRRASSRLHPRPTHPSSGRWHPAEQRGHERRSPKPWQPWSWSQG